MTIMQFGRAKAYRPLPRKEREAAFRQGREAYERDDWFLAHELLEPAWMGTDELPDRALVQGLIKLAAAHVHLVRGNPRGVAKNLEGSRTYLGHALEAAADPRGLDLPALLAAVDDRLAALASGAASIDPIDLPTTDPLATSS